MNLKNVVISFPNNYMVDFMQTVYKSILLISLFSSLLFSQSNILSVSTRTEIINQLFSDPSLEVTREKENIVKIKNKISGSVYYYDIGNHQGINLQKSSLPSLTINLATLDTSQNILYSWWQNVPITGDDPLQLKIIDSNHDGKKELFGYYVNVEHTTSPAETRVYQYDSNKTFSRVKEYADSLWVRNFGDLENDGIIDMVVRKDSSFRIDSNMFGGVTKTKIYSAKNSTLYLTEYKAEVSVGISLPRGTYFMDVDGDKMQELIYNDDDPEPDTIPGQWNVSALAMFRYDTASHQFTKTFKKNTPDYRTGFYQFGDFDNDGKINVQTGSIHGQLLMFEYEGKFGTKDSFSLQTVAQMPTYNLYYQAATNDVDNNGKKELWVGGAAFFNNSAVTQLFVFESNTDNVYQQVFQINLLGIFFLTGQTITSADIDNDSKQEIVLSGGGLLMIFKYNDEGGIYKLHYYKRLFGSDEKRIVEYTTLNDVDDDGSLELLVCTRKEVVPNPYAFTETVIYKYNKPLSAPNTASQNRTYQLHQNYPNPFNPFTTVTFSIPKYANVKIIVYDLLGKEITTLFSNNVNIGEYSIQWNGKNSSGGDVSSGIYFVRLTTNDFQRTIKILLQK